MHVHYALTVLTNFLIYPDNIQLGNQNVTLIPILKSVPTCKQKLLVL